MATDNPASILVQPGRLVWGATDLSTAFPHGGTSLGYTRDGVRLVIREDRREITTEETGIATQEIIALGSEIRLEVTLLQWDDDTLQRVFFNTDTGATSTDKYPIFPGSTVYPGYKLSNKSGVLVFSPTDLTNNKVILFRKAIPVAAIPLNLEFGVTKDTELGVVFVAIPDSSIGSGDGRYNSRTAAIADRRDLSIS